MKLSHALVVLAGVLSLNLAARAEDPGPAATPATVPVAPAAPVVGNAPATVTPPAAAPATGLKPDAKAGGRKDGKNRIEQYDLDGDGTLNDDELQKAGEVMAAALRQQLEQFVSKCDANRDGALDAAETAKLKEALAKNKPAGEQVARFDANKDYKLDGPECLAASQVLKEQLVKKAHQKKTKPTGGATNAKTAAPFTGASSLPKQNVPPPVKP